MRNSLARTPTGRGGGWRERGEVNKYLEGRRIICAVVEAKSLGICQSSQQAAFPFVFSARCCVIKAMWIYRLVVGLAVVSCCGKFFFLSFPRKLFSNSLENVSDWLQSCFIALAGATRIANSYFFFI